MESEDGSEGEGFTEAAEFFKQELGKIESEVVAERERGEELRAEMREEARLAVEQVERKYGRYEDVVEQAFEKVLAVYDMPKFDQKANE